MQGLYSIVTLLKTALSVMVFGIIDIFSKIQDRAYV